MNSGAHLLRSSRWPSSIQMLRDFSTLRRSRPPPSIGSTVSLPELPELTKSNVPGRAIVRASDLLLREKVLGTNTENDSPQLVLLSGSRGSGKSTSLRSAITTARKSGCVVMYIPRASVWTHGDGFFAAARGMEDTVKKDELPIRWYDRPFQISQTLTALLKSHASDMEAVSCGEHGTVREAAEEAVRVVENVDDDWRTMPRKAGNLFSAVVESLASDENMRFVVAIDEYECFAGLSSLGNGRGRWIHSSGISSVGRHFGRDAIQTFANSIRNGAVVLAQSGYCNGMRIRPSRVLGTEDFEVSEQIRRDPNGTKWLEEMWTTEEKGKGIVQFDMFTMKEMEAIMEIEAINTTGTAAAVVNSELRERVALLAGGRGDVLRKLVNSQ